VQGFRSSRLLSEAEKKNASVDLPSAGGQGWRSAGAEC
jgi:hypothetical protein